MKYLKKETLEIVRSVFPDSIMFDKLSCIPDKEERILLIKAAKKFIDYINDRDSCPNCTKHSCCTVHDHENTDCKRDDCWSCLIGRTMDQTVVEEDNDARPRSSF